jgi:cell division protein FtsN
MRMSWLWEHAVTLATVLTAVAVVVALIYGHVQITENRSAQHEANANELWREMQLAFDNPKFSIRPQGSLTSTMTISPSMAARSCSRNMRSSWMRS